MLRLSNSSPPQKYGGLYTVVVQYCLNQEVKQGRSTAYIQYYRPTGKSSI